VRHLRGKSGKDDSAEDLYLNADTGKAVHVGSAKQPANLQIFGDVSIGLGDTAASRTLQIEGKGIHSGGGGAGLSFADRAVSGFVETARQGSALVWYAAKGSARLWSGSDRLSIDAAGNLALGGLHAIQTKDTWLRLNQEGAFRSGVHTPGHLTSGSLNVGAYGEAGTQAGPATHGSPGRLGRAAERSSVA
jgi:hypothetical protein